MGQSQELSGLTPAQQCSWLTKWEARHRASVRLTQGSGAHGMRECGTRKRVDTPTGDPRIENPRTYEGQNWMVSRKPKMLQGLGQQDSGI